MVPALGVPGGHEIELIGELAGILTLGEPDIAKPRRLVGAVDPFESKTMVAGAGFTNCFTISNTIIPPYPTPATA
jgi:site-specific DNA recombinase